MLIDFTHPQYFPSIIIVIISLVDCAIRQHINIYTYAAHNHAYVISKRTYGRSIKTFAIANAFYMYNIHIILRTHTILSCIYRIDM